MLNQIWFQRQADIQLLLLCRSFAHTFCSVTTEVISVVNAAIVTNYSYAGMITLCVYLATTTSPKHGTELLFL